MVHPRIGKLQEKFSQDWEVYMVLNSDLKLASYVELDTICCTDDLYNMIEIIEARNEFLEVDRLRQEAMQPKR